MHVLRISEYWKNRLCPAGREHLQSSLLLAAACSGRRSLLPVSEAELWFHMLVLPPDKWGFLSQLWVPMFQMASPLTCVLSRETCLVLFVNYSRLSTLLHWAWRASQ